MDCSALPEVVDCSSFPEVVDRSVSKLKASIVSQDLIFSPKSQNGLGLRRIAIFWSAIKMGWLRRLNHESFWKTLHLEDLKDKSLLFNPHSSNETLIKKALKNMKTPQ